MAVASLPTSEFHFDEIEARVGALLAKEPIICKSWEEQDTTIALKLRNVACLPQSILSKVIGYLDAKSLAQAVQVCKLWRKLCGRNKADVLDLSSYNNVTDQTLYIQLNNYPLLSKLNLSGCSKITSNAITYIQKFAHNLVVLQLRGCKWFNSRSVAGLLTAKLSNLEELGLGYCINLSDDSLAMLLSATPKLRHLDIAGCTRISDNGVANISSVPHLTSLNISNIQNLTEKCLVSLNPSLESLTVTIKKNPTSKTLLKAQQAIPNLRELSFVSSTVPLALLNDLPTRFPSLVSLSLVNCPGMTDEKVPAIQKHKSIQNISITGCSYQTTKRKFPDVQMVGGKQVQSSFLAERLPLDYNASFFNNPQNYNHL